MSASATRALLLLAAQLHTASTKNFRQQTISSQHQGATFSLQGPNTASSLGDKDILRVQVLGMFDTGTELLANLLHDNFRGQLRAMEYEAPVGSIWKHSDLSLVHSMQPWRADIARKNGLAAVAIVREPLSWLQSVHRFPYLLEKALAADDWITAPTRFDSGSQAGTNSSASLHFDHEYGSIVHVWNTWAANYLRLQDFGYEKAVWIRYEDLVVDTQGTLNKIAKALRLRPPAEVRQQEDAAKFKGATHNQAVDKISNQKYLYAFTAAQLQDACSQVDRELVHQYNYTDCIYPHFNFLRSQ